jgi:hypothetical protein
LQLQVRVRLQVPHRLQILDCFRESAPAVLRLAVLQLAFQSARVQAG